MLIIKTCFPSAVGAAASEVAGLPVITLAGAPIEVRGYAYVISFLID